jgi:hypothetical protein
MASFGRQITPRPDANVPPGKPQPNHNATQRNIYTFEIHVAVLRSTTTKESPSYTTHILADFSKKSNSTPKKMAAPPAVTAHILRNFSIAFVGIVGTIAGITEVYNIASLKDRESTYGWGERRPYNAKPQPQQDRL